MARSNVYEIRLEAALLSDVALANVRIGCPLTVMWHRRSVSLRASFASTTFVIASMDSKRTSLRLPTCQTFKAPVARITSRYDDCLGLHSSSENGLPSTAHNPRQTQKLEPFSSDMRRSQALRALTNTRKQPPSARARDVQIAIVHADGGEHGIAHHAYDAAWDTVDPFDAATCGALNTRVHRPKLCVFLTTKFHRNSQC